MIGNSKAEGTAGAWLNDLPEPKWLWFARARGIRLFGLGALIVVAVLGFVAILDVINPFRPTASPPFAAANPEAAET